MSWNSGAGRPNTFQCSACRRTDSGATWPEGSAQRVTLTGRTKPAKVTHSRVSNRSREYRCGDCGHVGWSNHIQLERKADAATASD